jgi:hypothetical protein
MLRPVHPRSINPPQLVVDLVDSVERCWRRDQVLRHLQTIDAQEILNIPVSSIPIEDCWAWHYERNELFSVRSCYRMLKETKKRREDWLESRGGISDCRSLRKQWCRLWGAKLPAKLKNSAWRLSHNSIPTEGVRHHRHMAESEACPICTAAVDSGKQALVEC